MGKETVVTILEFSTFDFDLQTLAQPLLLCLNALVPQTTIVF